MFDRIGGKYQVMTPVAYDDARHIPAGFVFEMSVPRLLRWLVNPHNPQYLLAACRHDYGLHVMGHRRVRAAAAFEEGLHEMGVPAGRRLALTLAVIFWNWE